MDSAIEPVVGTDPASAETVAREAMWQLAANSAGIGTYVLHLPTRELVADDQLLALCGLTRADFTGQMHDVYARIHPDDLAAVTARVEHSLATGGAYTAQYRARLPDGTHRWLAASGQVITGYDGSVTALVGATYDVTALREATSHISQLLETMPVGYLALDTDWCITYLNDQAVTTLGPREALLGREIWDAFPATVGTIFEDSYRRAAATGELVTFDAYYPPPLDGWFEVRAAPQVDGLAVYFTDITARHRAQQDAQLALEQAQLATEHAQLAAEQAQLAAEQSRVDAEVAQRATAQQTALVVVAQALSHAETEQEVLSVLANQGMSVLGAFGSGLCLQHGDGTSVRMATTDDFDPDVRSQVRLLPADFDLPNVHTAVTGAAHFLRDRAEVVASFPGGEALLVAARVQASASVPLQVGQRLLGSLSLGFAHERTFTDQDRDLLAAFAALTAQALERISAHHAEQTAHAAERAASAEVARFSETLQRSLLTSPPEPEHLHIAVRYSPAAATAQVGGDWYDAFLTADGATSLVIGDVTGHDRTAAAAMGQLRNLLRGIGYTVGQPPARVLSVLDRAAHDLAVDTTATAVLARIEQTEEQRRRGQRLMRWSNAGHLPPLLIAADGSTSYLEGVPDLMLGISPSTDRHDHQVVLEPDSTVLLYTDGLVERRGAPLQEGLDWLLGAVAELADLPVDELCDALLEQVGGQLDDDVALLALRAYSEDEPRPVEAGPHDDPR